MSKGVGRAGPCVIAMPKSVGMRRRAGRIYLGWSPTVAFLSCPVYVLPRWCCNHPKTARCPRSPSGPSICTNSHNRLRSDEC